VFIIWGGGASLFRGRDYIYLLMLDWISLVFIDEQLESSSIAPHDQIISELHLSPVEAI
jgi:hypothetical protein